MPAWTQRPDTHEPKSEKEWGRKLSGDGGTGDEINIRKKKREKERKIFMPGSKEKERGKGPGISRWNRGK